MLELGEMLAGSTGLEPAASGVTGRRSNQLNYDPALGVHPAARPALRRPRSACKRMIIAIRSRLAQLCDNQRDQGG